VPGAVVGRNLAPKPYQKTAGGWSAQAPSYMPQVLDTSFVRRPGTVSVRTDRQASTPNALLAATASVGGSAFSNSGRPAVEPGKTYTLSVYWASSVPGARYRMRASWYAAGNVLIS